MGCCIGRKKPKVPSDAQIESEDFVNLQKEPSTSTVVDTCTPDDEPQVECEVQEELANEPPQVEFEPTVSDLQLEDIEKLRYKLDPEERGISNWSDLAYALLGDDPNISELIIDCRCVGNPAFQCLEKLHCVNSLLTVQEFSEKARKLARIDVVKFLTENCSDVEFLSDVKLQTKLRLCSLLNEKHDGISNWEEFMNSYEEVKYIRSTEKERNKCGPTECLIQILQEREPDMSLTRVKDVCTKQLMRNDVGGDLENIIKERKKKQCSE